MSQLIKHSIAVRLDWMAWTHTLHNGYHVMYSRFYAFSGAYYPSFSFVPACLLY